MKLVVKQKSFSGSSLDPSKKTASKEKNNLVVFHNKINSLKTFFTTIDFFIKKKTSSQSQAAKMISRKKNNINKMFEIFFW